MEAEAAKPKEEIVDEECMNESKPLGIAQIVYHENKVRTPHSSLLYTIIHSITLDVIVMLNLKHCNLLLAGT